MEVTMGRVDLSDEDREINRRIIEAGQKAQFGIERLKAGLPAVYRREDGEVVRAEPGDFSADHEAEISP